MKTKIAVIGLWHQGVIGAACLADWGYDVLAADNDCLNIENLKEGIAPIFEPGLNELIANGQASGNLDFTTSLVDSVRNRPYVLVMHDTPVDDYDNSDLTIIFRDIKEITPSLTNGVVLHITSQLPVGTCDEIISLIKYIRPNLSFSVAYSPENLRLGQAIERFKKPPLPIIGCNDVSVFHYLEDLYRPSGVNWQWCNLRTAEMSKHALNAFLALSVTFANELGNLCDELNADGHRLAELLRMEPRIGEKAMLFPGLGFSGGTLARDMQTLREFGDRFGIETPLLDGMRDSNLQQNKLVLRKLQKYFDNDLNGLKICILGLTYKPNTSTLRRSAALEVISDLIKEGVEISASDPKADPNELKNHMEFTVFDDPIVAARNADAIVLMTPWPEYLSLNFNNLKNTMRGVLIFDTSNLLKSEQVIGAELKYMGIGRGGGVKG